MILHNDTWFGQRASLAMCSKFAVYLANIWMKSFWDKVSGHLRETLPKTATVLISVSGAND